MKKLLVVLMLVFAGLSLVACGSDESEGKIEITFWHMAPLGSEAYAPTKAIINQFNRSQDVYFIKETGFSFWDYWDKIDIAISSRTAPDVGLSTVDDVPIRASAGVLYNISELLEADTSDNKFDLDDFYPNQLEFATYNGDLYAMPFSATTRALYYNKDMFAAAGLTEADVPTTWSELKTIAQRLTIVEDGEIVQLGFEPTYGAGAYHCWLWQTGEDFFDDNLNPTLNTQTHLDVLNWIYNFNNPISRDQITTFGQANQMLGISPFASERVAMIVETDGLYSTIKNAGATFNYGVAPIPVPDNNGIHVNWGSGFSIELYNNGKGQDEKKAGAWEFLKFLLEHDTQIALAEANGWFMSNKPAMEEYVQGNEILEALLAEVDYAVDKMYVPYAPSWHGEFTSFFDAFLAGTKTAEQTLADARNHYLQKKANYEALNK
ncbi:MAG: ABC transporter substrate-binding protein [Acholeplasmataceae bacterium]|jgi:multiple sugar transport system substrate-binding protein|nr:ABC transporter substrate-binding protein [Acholeplasmataceae bacterium]